MLTSAVTSNPALLGESGLFGVYTPSPDSAAGVGLITLNAGMLASPGPYRLHVELAERLSGLSIPSLRIDQSGKGESPLRAACTPSEALLQDYDEAFAYLQKRGVSSVVLFGVCSGAVDALVIASQRPSVGGLVLLDGYYEKTWRSIARHYGARLGAAEVWLRFFHRRLGREQPAGETADALDDLRDWTRLDGMRQRFRDCLARGTPVLGVFSGDWTDYNYEGQLRDFVRPAAGSAALTEVRIDEADHVYTLSRHRERLLTEVVGWMKATFP